MVKTTKTQLVKGSVSQNQAAQLKKKKEARTGSPTHPKSPKLKVRHETSAHKSQKLNAWTPKEMDEAVFMYQQSREPGYQGKAVSDPVCRQIDF